MTTDANLLTAAMHALRSYQHGNDSGDLAQEIADKIEQRLSALECVPSRLLAETLPYLEDGHVHFKVMDHGTDISQPCPRCELAKQIRQFISPLPHSQEKP